MGALDYRDDYKFLFIKDLLAEKGPVTVDGLNFDVRVDVEFRKPKRGGSMEIENLEIGKEIYIMGERGSYLVDVLALKVRNVYVYEQLIETIKHLAFDRATAAYSFSWVSDDGEDE